MWGGGRGGATGLGRGKRPQPRLGDHQAGIQKEESSLSVRQHT